MKGTIMTDWRVILVVATLLMHCCLVNGYFLDASCDDTGSKPKRLEIMRAMGSAHFVARAALAALQEIKGNPGVPSEPHAKVRHEAFSRFLGTLLGDDGLPKVESKEFKDATAVYAWVREQTIKDGVPGKPEQPPRPQRKTPEDTTLPVVRYGALDNRHVVIFCDVTRFDFKIRPGVACDTNVGTVAASSEDEMRAKTSLTKRPEGGFENFDSGWSYNPKLNPGRFKSPVSIQIHPQLRQFYEYVGGINKGFYNLRDWYGHQTSVDSFMGTLDAMLFHELTHSYMDPEVDISDAGGYGWENCVRSSKEVGWKNADSLTIFAWLSALSHPPTGLDYGADGIPRPINT